MVPLPNGAKEIANRLWDRIICPRDRAVCPYGSHIPVLMLCAALFKPRRVLELGVGFYSTRLFLEPECFPTLEMLHSIENDGSWYEKICGNYPDRARWNPQLISGSVDSYLGSLDLSGYDLIFVDDSNANMRRYKTMNGLRKAGPECPVVVHDAECWRVRTAVWNWPVKVIFDAFNPQCALCFSTENAPKDRLESMVNILRPMQLRGAAAEGFEDWVSIGRESLSRFPGESHLATRANWIAPLER